MDRGERRQFASVATSRIERPGPASKGRQRTRRRGTRREARRGPPLRALPAEHHVLGAAGYLRQSALERPQRYERARKQKEKVSRDDLESRARQKGSRVVCRQHLRITIEGNPAHDQSCAWIPRIVFPEREVATDRQRAADVCERAIAKRRLDVMKHAVAIREVERAGRRAFVDRAELHADVGALAARQIDARARDVHAGDGGGRQTLEELPCAASCPASVVEYASGPTPV